MSPSTQRPRSGHRTVPHTADTRIEAWAPSREQCVAEAVSGLVGSFADSSAAPPDRSVTFDVPPGPDEDMLVTVLDEVIYRLEVRGEVPVDTVVTPAPGGGMQVRFAMAPAHSVPAVGAQPKAVSLHALRFGRGDEGWSCAVTVDV